MRDEPPNYNPHGAWAELIDVAMHVERAGRYKGIEHDLERLAVRFELMDGQRGKDIGRIFRALATMDIADDDFRYDLDDEDDEREEDKPLSDKEGANTP